MEQVPEIQEVSLRRDKWTPSDFEFKAKAKDFVDGRIDEANAYFRNRDKMINNTATFGQFLSSHDENGFLISSLGETPEK